MRPDNDLGLTASCLLFYPLFFSLSIEVDPHTQSLGGEDGHVGTVERRFDRWAMVINLSSLAGEQKEILRSSMAISQP